MHLDFEEVKEIFEKSNSRILLLTHISQRYEDEIEEIKKKVESDRIFILSDFDSFKFEKNMIELKLNNKVLKFLRDEKTGKVKLIS